MHTMDSPLFAKKQCGSVLCGLHACLAIWRYLVQFPVPSEDILFFFNAVYMPGPPLFAKKQRSSLTYGLHACLVIWRSLVHFPSPSEEVLFFSRQFFLSLVGAYSYANGFCRIGTYAFTLKEYSNAVITWWRCIPLHLHVLDSHWRVKWCKGSSGTSKAWFFIISWNWEALSTLSTT